MRRPFTRSAQATRRWCDCRPPLHPRIGWQRLRFANFCRSILVQRSLPRRTGCGPVAAAAAAAANGAQRGLRVVEVADEAGDLGLEAGVHGGDLDHVGDGFLRRDSGMS